MTSVNKALVSRYYYEVLNARHLELLDFIADPAFVSYLTKGSIDLATYKKAVAGTLAAMPDLQVTIDDQIAEGDKVVTRWTAHATPGVAFAGIQPGKPITITAMHIHRVRDGKLIEHWEAINLHAAVQG